MADLVPPAGVRAAAKRGIALVQAGKAGDGFMPATLERAHKIANGERLTPAHVKRMHSFFSRHAVDRKPDWGKAGSETPGYVAWMAWGGDPGASWSAKVARQLKDNPMREQHTMTIEQTDYDLLLDETEAQMLEVILSDLAPYTTLTEDHADGSDEFQMIATAARSVAQSMADEATANGDAENAAQFDAMAQQLTDMLRRVMQIDAAEDQAEQAAASTYEDGHGAVSEDAGIDPLELMMNDGPQEDGEDYSRYNDRQIAQIHSTEDVVEEFGQYDQGTSADGAHYAPGDKNPFKAEGLVCQHCEFFEAGACEVVAGQIDPEGICKLWVIPEDQLAQ
jgi:hypothetical protein